MRIPEKVVAAVVQEASKKMADAKYAQVLIGTWARTQPHATQYLSAHVKELGGAEAVVNAAFHSALMATCFSRNGRSARTMTFADLDAVSDLDRDSELKRRQPALYDYIVANVEKAPMQRLLMLIALGLDYVA